MAFKHSPERDEELFAFADRVERDTPIEEGFNPVDVTKELAGIAKKWRAKAMMREQRIKELEDANTQRENDFEAREGER